MITFALTSCGRPDLLERTLDSFFKYNTYPIERYKIIDDSTTPEMFEELVAKFPQIEWTFNWERLGQSKSIDILYDDIDTEYIFHCEDDWEFQKSGFIEESLKFMGKDPMVIQAWLRGRNDTNGHPLIYGEEYDRLSFGYNGIWHGFSFNPVLITSTPLNSTMNLSGMSNVKQEKSTHPMPVPIPMTTYT